LHVRWANGQAATWWRRPMGCWSTLGSLRQFLNPNCQFLIREQT